VVEVGGGAGGGGAGDGAGGVLVGGGFVVWFEDDPVEDVEATLAVVACVRAGVSFVPVVGPVARPPPASPPRPEGVDGLTLLAASLGARRVTCPTGLVPGLSERTTETACPSSAPESAGKGSGPKPTRLAQRAASHPASAMPSATFPTRTARSRRLPFATKTGRPSAGACGSAVAAELGAFGMKTGSPSAGAWGSAVAADIGAFLLTGDTACQLPRIRLKHIPQFRPSGAPPCAERDLPEMW